MASDPKFYGAAGSGKYMRPPRDPRELLNQVSETAGDNLGPWSEAVAKMHNALWAVLELHKPVLGDEWCDEDGFAYPCLTVRAITRELEKP